MYELAIHFHQQYRLQGVLQRLTLPGLGGSVLLNIQPALENRDVEDVFLLGNTAEKVTENVPTYVLMLSMSAALG